MNVHQRSIYVTWKHEFKESFHCPQSLSSQKIKSFSELNCLILSKRFLGQPLAYSIRNFDWSSLYNLYFLREISSSYFWKGIKRSWVSCCRGFLNTREGLSLCGSDFVKGFYKESGKSQVGCLRTGRRRGKWPNLYKSSLHSSLPLNLFYLLLFIFFFKEAYFELSFE